MTEEQTFVGRKLLRSRYVLQKWISEEHMRKKDDGVAWWSLGGFWAQKMVPQCRFDDM